MYCSIPVVTAKTLSKIFDTKIQIKETKKVGPDERIYYCNDSQVVWVRDYMSDDRMMTQEPAELKALVGINVKAQEVQDYKDLRYMLCKIID